MSLQDWLTNQMEVLLGFSDPSLVSHIISLKDEGATRAYCQDIFGDQHQFIDELVKRRKFKTPNRKNVQKATQRTVELAPFQRKPQNAPVKAKPKSAAQLAMNIFGGTYTNAPPIVDKRAKNKKPDSRTNTPEPPVVEPTEFVMPEAYKNRRPKEAQTKKEKKRLKYKNIDETDKAILLPGRNKCDCQGQKHDLINNCIRCGRIVCEQEGQGPCLFCGSLVTTNRIVGSCESSKKANEHKDRLLEFDRNAMRRTKVIDDETDYYQGIEEDKIREQKYGDRKTKKFTLNLLTEDLEEQTLDEFIEVHKVDVVQEKAKENRKENLFYNEDLQNNNLNYKFKTESDRNDTKPTDDKAAKRKKMRLQNSAIMDMYDSGTCLTMQQPWASLLISGIKLHEGRVWNCNHRGRLWIHAGAKEPDPEMIKHEENNHNVTEKVDYPTSALLGFVTVDEILPQDEYRIKFPDGKSEAPFVFICSYPTELEVKIPLKGHHKLWQLTRDLQNSARMQLNL